MRSAGKFAFDVGCIALGFMLYAVAKEHWGWPGVIIALLSLALVWALASLGERRTR